jgi:hypothetical protein
MCRSTAVLPKFKNLNVRVGYNINALYYAN